MPKVSVYLPDELYRAARDRGLPISSLAQEAIEKALAADATRTWVDRIRARPPLTNERIDVPRLLDEVRDEFGT